MSFNKILAKKAVGMIVKDGITVTLSVATRTTHWTRPDVAVGPAGDLLKKSVAEWKEPLPAGTKDICSRETDHSNPKGDARDHLTVVCSNEEGEGKTRHVPVDK
ncbi:predicted protein [Histoplasma capsulatum var. duboisii H88]|uniref:Predicted protein n=2 Tax=Ajellomyces capsulatus TaxID=5037 RepID=F0UDZ7_AJEC8|nr:predicted protein [Histoplasma capsulatum H143]EGC45358.1 predicted protein [Histoplasma capsulatum var. duboisii H88]